MDFLVFVLECAGGGWFRRDDLGEATVGSESCLACVVGMVIVSGS